MANLQPSAIKLFLVFALGLLFAEGWILLRTFLDPNLGYPFNQVFYHASERGNDFFISAKVPDFYPMFWTMPPVAILWAYLAKGMIATFGENPALVLFSIAWTIPLWFAIRRTIRGEHRNTLAALVILTCFPVLFCLDRGHYAGVVLTCLAFAWNDIELDGGKKAKYFIALAASIKIVPIGFVLLFLPRKLYRQAFESLLLTLGVSLVSGLIVRWCFLSHYDDRTWTDGMTLYRELAMLSASIDFDSTLWASIRNTLALFKAGSKERLVLLLTAYQSISVLIGASLLVGAYKKFWSAQDLGILIVLYMLIFPPVMQDYYLALLLLPILSLINRPRSNSNTLLFWILVFAVIPKPIFISDLPPIRLSTIANPVLMTTAFAHVYFRRVL